LNFYFRSVIKIHQPTTKMPSFKEELTATVNSVRKNIKTEAINCFINKLKTSMRWTAQKGETKGAIALRINFMDDDDDDDDDEEYVLLRRLNDILLIEEVNRTKEDFEGSKIYEWLLKQIHKTGVFDGICIIISDYEMEYFWEVEEE
jgi:hypothetical protein